MRILSKKLIVGDEEYISSSFLKALYKHEKIKERNAYQTVVSRIISICCKLSTILRKVGLSMTTWTKLYKIIRYN